MDPRSTWDELTSSARHIDYGIMWIDDDGYATKQRFLYEGLDSDHKWVQYESP